jgi:hypothetical protein
MLFLNMDVAPNKDASYGGSTIFTATETGINVGLDTNTGGGGFNVNSYIVIIERHDLDAEGTF